MTRAPALLIATTAVGALLTSCGGSGLSHDDFVQRADGVCAGYDAAVKRLRTPHTLMEVERYTGRVLPIYRHALADLAALRPPRPDQPRFRAWLRADRRIERDLLALIDAARSRQIPRVQDVVARATADNRRSNRIARRLGLTVCSKG